MDDISVTGSGPTRRVISEGMVIDETVAWEWATDHHGFAGTFDDWLVLPAAERAEYERKAAVGE